MQGLENEPDTVSVLERLQFKSQDKTSPYKILLFKNFIYFIIMPS